jgi:hypothetical protein
MSTLANKRHKSLCLSSTQERFGRSMILLTCLMEPGGNRFAILDSSIVMYNFGVGPRFAFVSASARAPK